MGKKHYAPAPPPPPKPSLLDQVVRLTAVAVFVVGAITLASPWLRGAVHPLPPAGWVCWQVERSTAAGSRRDGYCDPAAGWHVEQWPGVRQPVAVPDRAQVVRRF